MHVPAGGSVQVVFDVRVRDMAFWDDQQDGFMDSLRGWSLGAGNFTIGGNFTISARSDAAVVAAPHTADPTAATLFVEV